MTMRRAETTYPWLLSSWHMAAATVGGVLTVLLDMNYAPDAEAWSPYLTIASYLPLAMGAAIFTFRNQVSDSGVRPLLGRVAEMGADGRLQLSTPVGDCPDCDGHMTVLRDESEGSPHAVWECSNVVREHRRPFDPLEFIEQAR